METSIAKNERLLLIDTCGETAGVCVCLGGQVLGAADLTRGNASAEILQAIRRLLTQQGWQIRDLAAIGVVSGPGSFTGTRAGLATAKGLCEATALSLIAVSRLEVLATAAGFADGFAALDAGQKKLYVREVSNGREALIATVDLKTNCMGRRIAVAEPRLLAQLEGCNLTLHPLRVVDALAAVLLKRDNGGSDVALTDANYVRQEADIYPKRSGAAG